MGPSWSKGRTAGHIFGRGPSNDYLIQIFFLLGKWFQTRRFLWEFPIGSYVKLSSAVLDIWRQRCSSSNIVNFDHLLYSNIRWHYWLVPDRFLLGIQDLTFDGGFKAFKWPDLVYGCLSCRHRNNIEKYKLALFLQTGKSKIFQKHLVCI